MNAQPSFLSHSDWPSELAPGRPLPWGGIRYAAFVLAAGWVIGISTRDLTIGSEIFSRTSPNLMDLLITLVGGLAGGFTFVSTGLSGVVVGVAIATALVPPLTTCGILLARQLPNAAAGAFLLFLAKFTAIARQLQRKPKRYLRPDWFA
jgi:hypothetical protein